ncbi:MAG: hypothetical protein FJW30_25240 [Acidobacteria bacterium]|nr:hypothetical protein [Acidobacteriota bacterium]
MPKWLTCVVVIVVFFVVAGYVERRRVLAMEAWRRARGFTGMEAGQPVIQRVAAQVTGREPNSLRWASVITGTSNGSKVTLAEICYTPAAARTSKWFTLVVWPAPDARGSAALNRGGRFAFLDGHAGWMTEGLLSPARADQLLSQVAEARTVPGSTIDAAPVAASAVD